MSAAEDIVLTPDPCLSQMCEPVAEIDDHIRELAERMLEDMYATEGCGLAAPQVGECIRHKCGTDSSPAKIPGR